MSMETTTSETSEQDELDHDLADIFETSVGELDGEQKRRLLEAVAETDTNASEYADEFLSRYEEDVDS